MHFPRRNLRLIAGLLLLALLGLVDLISIRLRSGTSVADKSAAQSQAAFATSYLDAALGRKSKWRNACRSCHSSSDPENQRKSSFLDTRAALGRERWAAGISLPTKCGACHPVPDPSNLPQMSWREVMSRMAQIMETRHVPRLDDREFQDILHFYFTFSRERQSDLGPDPAPAESPLRFTASPLGIPASQDRANRPFIGHVEVADLDQDGNPDVLVSDTGDSAIQWIHKTKGAWQEDHLATLPNPARTRVFSDSKEGAIQIAVACLGTLGPSDELVGQAVLLSKQGVGGFSPRVMLDHVARVADVEPGDFDGDGKTDFVVAIYGFINQGEVGWLENQSNFAYHPIVKRAGAIDVLPVDLNRDGRLDFVALFAQEHEVISAFINEGNGKFREQVLFKAATPAFGSSGIQLVDLDQDGDVDILYTNGDNLDLPTIVPRPFHGVQWLENRGNLNFVWHDLHRCYGAYCAVAGDLNRDGRPDIVVTTLFNDWNDPKRASLLWLENRGGGNFSPHTLATRPTHLISAAIGDMNGDGWPEIVASGMHGFPPFDRLGRVTLWRNEGPKPGRKD